MELFLFFIGLAVGSFVNVLADRLSHGISIMGRSRCDHCKKKLAWYDLVPVVSYILLRGRCRYCKGEISLAYPLVEIVTALLFLLVLKINKQSNVIGIDAIQLGYQLTITVSLIVIFVSDIKYRIIPDEANIAIGLSAIIFLLLYMPGTLGIHFTTAFVMGGLFLLLVIITSGKGMGLGDVKYVFAAGLLLGFAKTVIALYLAFLTGAVFSLILILIGSKTMKSTIAFGPFLTGATLAAFLFGEQLWRVFAKILGI